MSAISLSAEAADELIPVCCSIGDKPVYAPISEIAFSFDGEVALAENARAQIVCEGKTVAVGTLSVSNYRGQKRTQGQAIIAFANLLLPKGKDYRLEISAGAIVSVKDPGTMTEAINVDFSVPENLGKAVCGIENGATVESTHNIVFYFSTETEPVGKPTMTLYREGVAVRTVEAVVGWDWNLGQVYADFGANLHFEKGVRYSLVLPEGCASARLRSDITNVEEKVDFVGGYAEPIAPLNYVWCNLFDHHPDNGVLYDVSFYYDRAIVLLESPKMQVFDGKGQTLLKEVTPVVTEENRFWALTGNFEGMVIPESGCFIVIPEGTIVTAEGDVTVNRKSSTTVNVNTGMEEMGKSPVRCRVVGRQLLIEGVPSDSVYEVLTMDGKTVACGKVVSSSASAELPLQGVYVVRVSGISCKVAVF